MRQELYVGDELVFQIYPWLPFFRHHGFYLGGNRVISNSERRGGVAIDSWNDFAQGRPVYRTGKNIGVKGLNYALGKVGQEWRLLDYNCEHFANECKTGKVQSIQLNATVLAVVFVGALLLIGKGRIA
ncbi:MAG: hypothetical protein GC134_00465 [Proteobacteria bacterium]|nr:hypothetical protein [Pseudomonadota bacterium]